MACAASFSSVGSGHRVRLWSSKSQEGDTEHGKRKQWAGTTYIDLCQTKPKFLRDLDPLRGLRPRIHIGLGLEFFSLPRRQMTLYFAFPGTDASHGVRIVLGEVMSLLEVDRRLGVETIWVRAKWHLRRLRLAVGRELPLGGAVCGCHKGLHRLDHESMAKQWSVGFVNDAVSSSSPAGLVPTAVVPDPRAVELSMHEMQFRTG